jgi:plastocyanin
MKRQTLYQQGKVFLWMTILMLFGVCQAQALIPGISPTAGSYNLSARADHITTGEGNSVLVWGLTDGARAQYPAPTLIVTQGQTITINLTNELALVPTSLVFPGHQVTASGGTPGLLTNEAAAAGGTVSYTFTATHAGTYLYHSGTNPALQIDMGLVGALIVRPADYNDAARTAYGDGTGTDYDYEVLFLHTEMDPRYHDLIEFGRMAEVDTNDFHPVYWFYNGRNGPDTLLPNNISSMPVQPYNTLPMVHPGGGRDGHPTHFHGNNWIRVAKDGRMLSSTGTSADLAVSSNTQSAWPGETYDMIFRWTGAKQGWDLYGTADINPHSCGAADDLLNNETGAGTPDGYHDFTWEDCNDHYKPLPVDMPGALEITFSPFYSGSPYLGAAGDLPPGEGGFNPWAGYFYPWHSHAEKELTNDDIFPGGMLTFLIIVPAGTPGLE